MFPGYPRQIHQLPPEKKVGVGTERVESDPHALLLERGAAAAGGRDRELRLQELPGDLRRDSVHQVLQRVRAGLQGPQSLPQGAGRRDGETGAKAEKI